MEPKLGYDKGLKYTKDSIMVFQNDDIALARGLVYATSKIESIPASTTVYLVGKTGTTRDVWMQLPRVISSEPDLEVYAFKNCVYTGGTGSAVEIHNKNHQSILTTDWVEMRLGATVTDEGEEFYTDYIAGSTGIGGTSQGGESGSQEKYLFDRDTYYCMKLVNNSTNINKIFYTVKWFESPYAV